MATGGALCLNRNMDENEGKKLKHKVSLELPL